MKHIIVTLVSIATLWGLATGRAQAVAGAPAPTSNAQRVDALLSDWNRPDTPGCAVAIIQDGQVIYKRGVGMADLERDTPIAPTTPFHVASMSKQFTAFAIELLAQDGKLSLDDDIRKFLPELHDFGKTITIRQLLHHTSGLRDQWSLLALAGWRLEDVITEDDIFGLIQRQQTLNFTPGKEHLYSNTGYTLLGIIAKRVSGKSLPVFAQERIFGPLGMTHTLFHDQYGTLVKGRALSYEPLPNGGYAYLALSYSNVGATSLFTTVEDLALWDRNFYDGRVGGKALLARMQTPGVLASGRPINYASGLVLDRYRGLETVSHSGADAGYRSELLRFPDQHFSVVVLANTGDLDPTLLARQIADIYLEKQLSPKPRLRVERQPRPHQVDIDESKLDALVGDYALAPNFIVSFTKENGALMMQATGQRKFPVFAANERTFFLKVVEAQFTFDAPGHDGIVAGGVLHQDGQDTPARRVQRRARLSEQELSRFEGEFYSPELHVLYTLKSRDGQLMLSYLRGEVLLTQAGANLFAAAFPFGHIQYLCDAADNCSGFTINDDRVRNLQFTKVSVKAVGAGENGSSVAFVAPALPGAAATFDTEAVYLRGSMNAWGLRDKMLAAGPHRYEASMTLDKGRYEFKIGSEDFQSIDLGAVYHQESVTLGRPSVLDTLGSNLVVELAKRSTCVFSLDATEPLALKIVVTAAGKAP